ncbi:YebC/PmpR family DNA-binding transcriptional regulator [bacterium]|jgi:YebC/PmpR family DNA-binding regulatory protein|nr:YebC/PmpR family DNA-binding transcriptional regulator [bacterium]MBT4250869.1 YebC/PmpR family DNA-binding transcriptional regulator [bacterium]MBT4597582.1 YebC/PmpR family DNA-binding transcriptional regulator [bacterium]MBT6754047.1 YebC/PmpR family DNA-binding transcriptional regulator [bacterium]MBT7038077.1 YebC/PmpR family DNA-binding transcriptional regulator [bacterium]
MSGHSKWSTIKHKKAALDAKRSNVFTKLAKDISVAAREGGDPDMNFKLRMAMDRARSSNMPKDNIERAIKAGTGENKDGVIIEELIYEGYGPEQVAILIKTATDNKNRTLSEVRNALNKNGGKMVEGGSVSWQFSQVGVLEIEKSKIKDEELEMIFIEANVNDYKKEEDGWVVYTEMTDLQKVKESLEIAGLKVLTAFIGYVAKDTIEISDKAQESYEKLLMALDQQDDVVDIFDNLN